jgi:hypothetical protein
LPRINKPGGVIPVWDTREGTLGIFENILSGMYPAKECRFFRQIHKEQMGDIKKFIIHSAAKREIRNV